MGSGGSLRVGVCASARVCVCVCVCVCVSVCQCVYVHTLWVQSEAIFICDQYRTRPVHIKNIIESWEVVAGWK